MFENCGEKCKRAAVIFFWIQTILSTIGIIVLISLLGWADGNPALLIILPFIYLYSWVSSLLIYTFGEIHSEIKNGHYIKNNSSVPAKNTFDSGKTYSQYPKNVKHEIAHYITCTNCRKQIDAKAEFCVYCGKPTKNYIKPQNAWICPKCGMSNPRTSRMCKSCEYQK